MALNGSRAKLRRAKHHLDTLEREIDTFLQTHPYSVVTERPTEEPTWIVTLKNPPTLPGDDWAAIIGDCVHNLRSSLDYVAWELAGSNPNDTETQFPIFDTEAGWNERVGRRLKHLPLGPVQIRALIKKVQPFHAPNPRHTPLSVIRQLDDSDKHKLLTVTAAIQERFSVIFEHPAKSPRVNDWMPDPVMKLFPHIALVNNAVLGTVTVTNPPPQVEMKAEIAPYVAFGESLGFGIAAVVPVLTNAFKDATAVVDLFQKRFFP